MGGPAVSQAVGRTALNAISNLMDADPVALSASANRSGNHTHLGRGLSLKPRPLLPPAGRLIRVVDELGMKLVVTGDSEVVSSDSLLLAVKKVDGAAFPPTSVDIYSTDNVQVTERVVLTWTSRSQLLLMSGLVCV